MALTDLVEVIPLWHLDMNKPEDYETWKELRKPTIGGSEVGTLLGINKYQSRNNLLLVKKGIIPGFQGNEATDIGHELELSVARLYAKRMNAAVVEWPVLLRSKQYPFMAANLDFIVVEANENDPRFDGEPEFWRGQVTKWEHKEPPPGIIKILECKTGAIASPGAPQHWFEGPEGKSVPDTYVCQGFWYMGTTGLPEVDFACLLGGHGLQIRNLKRDDTIIAELRTAAEQFYVEMQSDYIPPMDGSESTEEALKEKYPRHEPGKQIDFTDDFLDNWNVFQSIKKAYAKVEERMKSYRSQIVYLIADAECATVNGTPVATYRTSRDSAKFDEKAFKATHPEEYEKWVVSKPGHRTLRKVG